ncbi:plasminogen-like [Saccostrea echinata]|uniref:plasminogen-like n=1 Tax=Saccostrea echinata TaxID=191078 RepID=UPI002A813884|nr:plasminogen-like [Saccostrea echinata]
MLSLISFSFVVVIVVFKSYGSHFRDDFFHRLLKADDKVVMKKVLAEFRGVSVRHCGLKCLEHYLCSSFFINRENKHCKLAGEVDLNNLVFSPGYRYYVSDDCKRSMLGWEYTGTRDRTVDGILCQRWDQQYPRQHTYDLLSSEHNYCRNPAKAYAKGPWCYTTQGDKPWNYCFVPKCVTAARECRTTKRGEDYFGTVNVTTTGIECQRWGNKSPRVHDYTILRQEKNYCRNPFGEKKAPWCYTLWGQYEFGYCDIPKC